ncbi:MAG: hypothetical protein HY701_03565, partial [Gemmatimonadetes bacterium]|nr:hypothetical protein [Gemmatimonadota bacterium]
MILMSRFAPVRSGIALAATLAAVSLIFCVAGLARAQAPASADTVVPGELLVEPPTLINLGFEWFVQGDENRNASVAVSYRSRGESAWKPALPLLRLRGERIFSESRVDVVAPNMF